MPGSPGDDRPIANRFAPGSMTGKLCVSAASIAGPTGCSVSRSKRAKVWPTTPSGCCANAEAGAQTMHADTSISASRMGVTIRGDGQRRSR